MSIRRSLAFSFMEKYASTGLNLLSTLVLARLLSPEEIGIYSVGAALVGLMHALRDFGVTNYLIQEREVDQRKLRTAFTMTLVLSWFFALALVAGSGWAAEFYEEPGIQQIVWVMAANFALIPFGSPILALMRRDMKFGRLAAIQLANTVVNVSVSILLAALGFGFMSLAWASLAGVATTSGLAFLSQPHAFLLRPGLHEWRSVFAFGSYATANAMIGDIRQTAPDLIIGRLLTFEAVGLHSRAIGLLAIFNKLIFEGVQPVLLPAMSEKVRRGEDLRGVYLRALEYITVLHWPFLAFLALMADPIIRILLGEQWLAVAPLVQIYCGISALSFPSFPTQPILIALGRIQDTLKISMIALPISLSMMVIGSLHNLTVVAWLSYVTGTAGFLLTLTVIRRYVRFSLFDLVRHVSRSALVTAIASPAPLAVLAWGGWHPTAPIPALLAAAAGFAGMWLLALFAVRHPFRDEIRNIWLNGYRRVAGR
jgi:O-antigen/teichoic acid export membrane protein